MDLGLQGKKALVTGSSRGLGYATALGLAEEGCLIAINSRNQEEIKDAAESISSSTNMTVVPIVGDLTLRESADIIINQAADSMGGLDILITNSGGPPSGKFESFDDQTWQSAVELNFLSQIK